MDLLLIQNSVRSNSYLNQFKRDAKSIYSEAIQIRTDSFLINSEVAEIAEIIQSCFRINFKNNYVSFNCSGSILHQNFTAILNRVHNVVNWFIMHFLVFILITLIKYR